MPAHGRRTATRRAGDALGIDPEPASAHAQGFDPECAGGQRDERNPDKAKRGRQVTGLQIYWDLVPHGDGWKGEGYSPEDGRYYKAHLRANGGKMTMKGCVSVFCRTVTWTKMS